MTSLTPPRGAWSHRAFSESAQRQACPARVGVPWAPHPTRPAPKELQKAGSAGPLREKPGELRGSRSFYYYLLSWVPKASSRRSFSYFHLPVCKELEVQQIRAQVELVRSLGGRARGPRPRRPVGRPLLTVLCGPGKGADAAQPAAGAAGWLCSCFPNPFLDSAVISSLLLWEGGQSAVSQRADAADCPPAREVKKAGDARSPVPGSTLMPGEGTGTVTSRDFTVHSALRLSQLRWRLKEVVSLPRGQCALSPSFNPGS